MALRAVPDVDLLGNDLDTWPALLGLLSCSGPPFIDTGSLLTFSASIRTAQFLITPRKLPSGTAIGTVKQWCNAGMTGGAASMAFYYSSSLTNTSWTKLGSTVTPTLTALTRLSTTFSASLPSDAYVRCLICLTSTPTGYPSLYSSVPLLPNLAGGHLVSGYSNATTVPSSLNPSTGWTDAIAVPLTGLAA